MFQVRKLLFLTFPFFSSNVFALTDQIEVNITSKRPHENQKCKITFKNTHSRLAQCIAQNMKHLAKHSCPSDDVMKNVASNCLLTSRAFPDDAGEIQYFIFNSKGKIINELNEGVDQ